MLLGSPFSQPFGAFHGRTDAFSASSVLAHPLITKSAEPRSKHQTKWSGSNLMIPDEPE
jgi:hypothetical protein